MEILLEDYKRRLSTAQEMLNEILNDSQAERINVKINMYKTFIVEIERAIARSKSDSASL